MRISDWSSDVCSSDLVRSWAAEWIAGLLVHEKVTITPEVKEVVWSALGNLATAPAEERTITGQTTSLTRSEEHTSELQSLMRISYAVFCLKKKHNKIEHQTVQEQVNKQHK